MKFWMVGSGKVAHLFYSVRYAHCGRDRGGGSWRSPLQGTPVCKPCKRSCRIFHGQDVPEVTP
jgi:hypothetical protein